MPMESDKMKVQALGEISIQRLKPILDAMFELVEEKN